MLLLKLIRRNILVYTRDKANIFFSLLAMLIVIVLMVVFLGKMNTDTVVSLLEKYGGVRNTDTDRANAQQLIILWTLAGVIIVNSVSITLSMVGIMVEDEAKKRLSSFYVAPVNRTIFVLGYVFAAFIMGIIIYRPVGNSAKKAKCSGKIKTRLIKENNQINAGIKSRIIIKQKDKVTLIIKYNLH